MSSIAPITEPHTRSRVWASPGWQTLCGSLVLLLATIALYYPVSHYPFADYDDPPYVTNNPQVQSGVNWSTVKWSITTYEMGTWHPLTWLSHALDCQLFEGNSGAHHDVNLALHVLSVLLLFWVLQQATGFRGRSFMVAALFALHPINVESVVWIAERKNVLSMLFFILALGAYRWYTREPRIGRYALVALLFALGLMAKAQIVTFPFVLLLWDYWPLRRLSPDDNEVASRNAGAFPWQRFWRLVIEKVPLFALSAANAILTMKAQRTAVMVSYPLSLRLEFALTSYVQYIGKAFWPSRLAVFYPHPDSVKAWQAGCAVLFLTAVTWLAVENWRRRPYFIVGWLFFLGTLVPMLGLEGVGYEGRQGMADRYAYLPLLGLFIMLCWGVAEWSEHERLSPSLTWAASAALLLVLALVASRQLSYWQDNTLLWSHAAQVTERNWLADDKLGLQLSDRGKTEESMPYFLRAQALVTDDYYSNLHIGLYQQQHGNLRQAIDHYKVVINSPLTPIEYKLKAFNNMCYAYSGLGDAAHADRCFQAVQKISVK